MNCYENMYIPMANQKHGGGTCIMHRSELSAEVIELETSVIYTHFEHMDCTACIDNPTVVFYYLLLSSFQMYWV